jgi:hypothetical protein
MCSALQFKVLKKNILDYQKEIEKARKVAECEAKKAAAAATRAARAHGRVTGNRGGRRGRGRGVRGRGRGAAAASSANAGTDDSDLDLEPDRGTVSSGSSSDSDSESEADIPMPRSCRQCPVRVIQGHREEVAEDKRNKPPEQVRPRPHMLHCPLEMRDVGEVEAFSDANAVGGGNEPETLRDGGGEHAIYPEVRTDLVPGVTEGSLEAQGQGIEAPSMVQSGENENQAGPLRRRNPRSGKQSDTTDT